MKKLFAFSMMAMSMFAYSNDLTVKVSVKTQPKGHIFLEMTNAQFADDLDKKSGLPNIYEEIKSDAQDKVLVYVFKDIKPGEYGVRGFIDMNSNKKLDRSGLLPTEPWGASGKRPFARAPKWKDMRFMMPDSDYTLEIIMK